MDQQPYLALPTVASSLAIAATASTTPAHDFGFAQGWGGYAIRAAGWGKRRALMIQQ